MRAVWTGALSFGLVNIPVKPFFASEERAGITFAYLHRTDLVPIRNIRVRPEEGEEVPAEEVVRGYEYKRGKYVVLEEEDFRRAWAQVPQDGGARTRGWRRTPSHEEGFGGRRTWSHRTGAGRTALTPY